MLTPWRGLRASSCARHSRAQGLGALGGAWSWSRLVPVDPAQPGWGCHGKGHLITGKTCRDEEKPVGNIPETTRVHISNPMIFPFSPPSCRGWEVREWLGGCLAAGQCQPTQKADALFLVCGCGVNLPPHRKTVSCVSCNGFVSSPCFHPQAAPLPMVWVNALL